MILNILCHSSLGNLKYTLHVFYRRIGLIIALHLINTSTYIALVFSFQHVAMMQILFDCERMKYYNTGLSSYCQHLGTAIQMNLDRRKMQLSFFKPHRLNECFGPGASYMQQNSLQKFWLPSLKRYDIWHCTYQNSAYIPSRNRKIKVLLTIHDLNFLYENKSESKKAHCLRHLQRNIDRSDALVCVSEYTKNDVLFHCDTKNKPLYTIHNGTNKLEDPLLKESSYKPKKPFLFSLGTFHRKKNFHVLLSLLRHNKYLELLIAGRPENASYISEIKRSASRIGVNNNVHLLFNISEEEKSWYFHNCYSFLLPSISEGFGLTIPEAMSVGKPVFLSGNTSLPEIGGDHAFYFKNFESEQMQTDFIRGMRKYERTDMQEIIKDHSRSFSWDNAAKAYLEVYESLINQ